MGDTKQQIMVVLLSFQSGRNEEWCERFFSGTLKGKTKLDPKAERNIVKETARQEKLKYLNIYADRILTIVKT